MIKKLLIGVGVLALLAVIGVAGYIVMGGGSGDYLARAKDHLAKGDYAAGLIELRNAVQANPEDGEARYQLGVTSLDVGDYGAAEKELRGALRLGVPASRVNLPLADAYLAVGKYDELLNELAPIGSPEEDSRLTAIKGFALLAQKKLDEAQERFDAAIAADPKNDRAQVGLARLYLQRKEYDKARQAVDAALAIDPESAVALTLAGRVQQVDGHVDDALSSFNKAIVIDPNQYEARLGRAAILVAQESYEPAREDIKVVLARHKTNVIGIYLSALIQSREGDENGAIITLEKMGLTLQNYPPALFLMSSLKMKRGELEQAESHLRSLIGVAPDLEAPRLLLAELYNQKNQPEQSIELIEPLYEAGYRKPQGLSLLANAYLMAGRPDEAAALLQGIIAEDPDNPTARTQLAVTQLSKGESELAEEQLRDLIAKDPGSVQANTLLILSNLREGKFDEAAKVAEAFRLQLPDSPVPNNLMGGINFRRGDVAAARADFEAALAIDPNFASAYLNLAQLAAREGDHETAKATFSKVTELDEGNLSALLSLGRYAIQDGEGEAALGYFRKAAEANPNSAAARIRLADFLLDTGELQEALATARTLVKLAPNDPRALALLGRAQLGTGQAGVAAATFLKATTLAPEWPLPYRGLAQALLTGDNPDIAGARNALESAVEKVPGDVTARRDLAILEMNQGNSEKALEQAQEIAKLEPENVESDLLIGDVSLRIGETDKALSAYRRALEKKPETRTVTRIFQAMLRSGNVDGALGEMEGWISTNPNDAGARFAYASHFLATKDYKRAATEFEKLSSIAPQNAAVLNNLAWLYDELGDERALEAAERALDRAPDSPQIQDTAGWLLVKRGTYERGLTLLRKANQLLPGLPEVQYHLAVALNATGKPDEALALLKKALAGTEEFSGRGDAEALLKRLQP
ncbi:XrtA/PEP-CTERM system TPR-repeat protein PrsT [Oceanibacterium hippocampi]|uniref:Tetratricopeptide repeat protein n=1 Tax=Oceanibacterium hippocampi TaxID=745714 RepID=A0A1Y5TPL2_9PROT|nr:XrtA/PEP-CTERM system TPR-repeat protein PrsT [Oceanibacterium hippocampi]SLN69025.1 tetratricopeptide repeat protein [Oceanibacterium hippocampi]